MNDRGSTMVEVLVAMAVMSILMLSILPRFFPLELSLKEVQWDTYHRTRTLIALQTLKRDCENITWVPWSPPPGISGHAGAVEVFWEYPPGTQNSYRVHFEDESLVIEQGMEGKKLSFPGASQANITALEEVSGLRLEWTDDGTEYSVPLYFGSNPMVRYE